MCLTQLCRPLGEIKYLKDDDDDCDLDPELFVADLLVDEGKAARDGADQKKTVKVVQERGHAIRQGSVIPDLTPIHYQPPTRPPIPRFPDVLEKRRTEDRQTDDRPTKRRRLDQIEEETNHIVNSIERDGERALSHFELPDAHFLSALNGNLNDAGPEAELKQESPELARTWINTGPATIDELELLPEAPAHFRPGSKTNTTAGIRQDAGLEIRESSAIPQENQQHQRNEDSNQEPDSITDGFARQQSIPHIQAPVTPLNAGNKTQTLGGRAISMLNSMKSNSPLPRQSASASTNKFRKPAKNIYDYPESDIDDTQMSPRSRASRTRITPKLVPTPFSKNTPKSNDASHRRDSQQPSAVQESPTQQNRSQEDVMDVNGDKENQLPHPQDQQGTLSHAKSNDEDRAPDIDQADGTNQRQSFHADKGSTLGSDETWSIHEDGTKTRRKVSRQSRAQRRSNGEVSTPRSSSAVSSAKATPAADSSTQQKPKKRKRTVPTRVSDVHSRSEISELDSPGMQLSETLRQSSPVTRPSKESTQSTSEAVSKSTGASHQEQLAEQIEDVEMDDVERPPESVSDDEEETPLMKTPKRPKTKSKAPASTKKDVRKCFTCWGKQATCDNVAPKCGSCTRNKKTCQIHNMTKDEALAEKAKRQAEKALKSSQKSGKKKGKLDPQPSQNVGSATDGEDESDDQQEVRASEVPQSQTTILKRKSNKTPSKVKNPEPLVSSRDRDEVSESDGKARAPRSSQSTATKSKTKKGLTETPSKASVHVQDDQPDSEDDASSSEIKKLPVSIDHSQARTELEPGKKKKKKKVQIDAPMHDTDNSLNAIRKQDLSGKGSGMSPASRVQTSIEETAPMTPAVLKETQPALANKSVTRERSMESHGTSTGRIVPSGMTDEEYDNLVGARANLTDAQRMQNKLQMRKLGKNRDSTPSLRHESSTQDLIERPKQDTSSIKSSQQAPPSSRSTSNNQLKPPPSTQPARAPASVSSSTPSSAPAKSRQNAPAANTSAKTTLKLQPATNTSAKTKSPNPPFQPSSSTQRKSVIPTSFTSTSTASPSLNTSRSLKDVRAALQSQSRSGSGANTPQPASTTAARIAEMRRVANMAATKKKMFSLSDDDEDEDEDEDSVSDEENTDEEEDQKASAKTTPKTVNGNGRSNVTVRRRTPSDSGSDGESSGDSEMTSGSGDEDDSDEE